MLAGNVMNSAAASVMTAFTTSEDSGLNASDGVGSDAPIELTRRSGTGPTACAGSALTTSSAGPAMVCAFHR